MSNSYTNHVSITIKLAVVFFLAFIISTSTLAQIQTNVPALKNVYARDFTIGCLLSYPHVGFATDPPVPGQSSVVDTNGGYLVRFHMNSMSPGNNMKPQYTVNITASAAAYAAAATQAERDSIDIHPTIQFNGNLIAQLNWAQRQGFRFRGHTLVWYSQTPGTSFFRSGYTSGGTRLTKVRMTERMGNYINEVIRLLHQSWPGLLMAFDVVNEAVNDNGTFRTASNEWYTTFGDTTFVMKAFELTRAAAVQYGETQIKLYYNDYNTHLSAKADGIVRLCAPIFQAGLLDGIGMQDHDANASPTAEQWIATYNKFAPICSEMSVTELDVNPGSGTPTPASLITQAKQYAMLFKCFVERSARSGRGKLVNVSKDGLNDSLAFVRNASLWTRTDSCKLAFYAAANVGINYNGLDSLIRHGDTLQQNNYTPSSWTRFASALASGRTARNRNYTNAIPADTLLGIARDSLQAGISGLIVTSVGPTDGNTPNVFALEQNYPNPFNPTTEIRYQMSEVRHVTLKIFDPLGREVATLVNEVKQPGIYSVQWNADGVASGIYLYRIESGSFVQTKKMVLLR
ncbi:MAG: endo-1,4-beta-xylanase [Ignavibacteriae bacterium]|nr:endo-1,4-beta-xylanase [Ignavibacteriota bacterium]